MSGATKKGQLSEIFLGVVHFVKRFHPQVKIVKFAMSDSVRCFPGPQNVEGLRNFRTIQVQLFSFILHCLIFFFFLLYDLLICLTEPEVQGNCLN